MLGQGIRAAVRELVWAALFLLWGCSTSKPCSPVACAPVACTPVACQPVACIPAEAIYMLQLDTTTCKAMMEPTEAP